MTIKNTLLITLLCFATAAAQMGPPPGSYRMLDGKTSTTVPFRLERNHVVLQIRVNGIEGFDFVLDTGMPAHGALLHGGSKTDDLGLEFIGQAMVGGAGGSNELLPASIAQGVSLALGDIELTEQFVIVMPYDSTSVLQRSHHGIIGYALFSRFAVTLDFEKMEITFTESDKFQYTGDGEIIPVEMNRNVPYFYTEIVTHEGNRIPVKLVVDLGAGHAISLNLASHDQLTLPANAVEARLGTGVSGDVIGHVGRIETLSIGGCELHDVVSSMTHGSVTGRPMAGENGNLGSQTLKRFTVTFDYTGKRVILEPNSTLNDPFEFNMAGFQFVKENNGLFGITRILNDSPAEEAGIQADDWIVRVDDRPAEEFTYDQLHDMILKEGGQMKFRLRRGDSEIDVSLTLRRLI